MRWLGWSAVLAALAAAPAFALSGATGALTQLPGAAGCVSSSPRDTRCAQGTFVAMTSAVVAASDGRNVYAAGGVGTLSALASFTRNRSTGRIAQIRAKAGCITMSPTASRCVQARAMETPNALALSPDRRNLYVAATNSGAIAVFRRNTASGVLTQLPGKSGCVASLNRSGHCRDATGLEQAGGVAVSPDGRNVYGGGVGVAAFARSSATGALTAISCPGCESAAGLSGVASVAVSPDGRNVYVAGGGGRVGSVVVFMRDAATGRLTEAAGSLGCIAQGGSGGCTPGVALQEPRAIVVSPDGRSVYVASSTSGGVAVFARKPATGTLQQLAAPRGCVTASGSAGRCRKARGLISPFGLAVSADGRSVYVASYAFSRGAIAVFARDRSSGALAQLPGKAGCLSTGGRDGCAPGRELVAASGVTVSRDGRNVYSAAGSRHESGSHPVGGGVAIFARTR